MKMVELVKHRYANQVQVCFSHSLCLVVCIGLVPR